MAYIFTGWARNKTLNITTTTNGVPSTVSYSILNGFTVPVAIEQPFSGVSTGDSFGAITARDLALLSTNDYNRRLYGFVNYVRAQHPGITIQDLTVGALVQDNVNCPLNQEEEV